MAVFLIILSSLLWLASVWWLCMTVVVIFIAVLQPEPVRRQTRGMSYIIGGGIAGLAVGLLGFTFTAGLSLLYACMMLGVVVGIFMGFLLYTNTPDGRPSLPGRAISSATCWPRASPRPSR